MDQQHPPHPETPRPAPGAHTPHAQSAGPPPPPTGQPLPPPPTETGAPTPPSRATQQPAPGFPPIAYSTQLLTAEERKAILAQQVQFGGAQGWRVESQSDFQAFLATGQQPNHVLHAILTIFTCLIWGVVWAVIAMNGGIKREMIAVDEYGNVHRQQLAIG